LAETNIHCAPEPSSQNGRETASADERPVMQDWRTTD